MSDLQIVFITLSIIFGLVIIGLYLFRPLTNLWFSKKYHKAYSFVLSNIAKENNYILLNNLILGIDEKLNMHIDHLLFADKFIYVIKDRYFVGSLEAIEDNRYWFFYNQKGKQYTVSNSIAINQERINRLSILTGVDSSMFVNVILINDNCNLAPSVIKHSNTYIVKVRRFKSQISRNESKDIPILNRLQLERLAKDLLKANKKN